MHSDEERTIDIEDTYVVRISRREQQRGKASARKDHPSLIVGVVERARTGQRRAFHGVEELWTVLAESGAPLLDGKRKPAAVRK